MVVVCCCCWLTLLFAGLLFTHSVKEGPTLTWWEWIFGENVQGWAGKVFSMIHICMGVRGRCALYLRCRLGAVHNRACRLWLSRVSSKLYRPSLMITLRFLSHQYALHHTTSVSFNLGLIP